MSFMRALGMLIRDWEFWKDAPPAIIEGRDFTIQREKDDFGEYWVGCVDGAVFASSELQEALIWVLRQIDTAQILHEGE